MTQWGSWGDCTFSVAEGVDMSEVERQWWATEDATVRSSDSRGQIAWPPLGAVVRDPGDYVGCHRLSDTFQVHLLGGKFFRTNLRGGAFK